MTNTTEERIILSGLLQDPAYMRHVIPFIKDEYFSDLKERRLYQLINKYIIQYNEAPSKVALSITVAKDEKLNEKATEETQLIVKDVFDIIPQENNKDWMIQQTEKWVKERALFNALNRAIDIQNGNTKNGETPHLIPTILSEALGICFDTKVGMDFNDDAEIRWDYYTNPVHKIPFGDLEIFNDVTDGGIPRKTLNFLVAGVNAGKSMGLISFACMYMRLGYNVLYISNEMSEEEVFKRMDANMLQTNMKDIQSIGKEKYVNRIEAMKAKSYGKLKVKEYGPSTSNVAHYRHLLADLKLKQNFVPDIVIVDYLQITAAASISRRGVNGFEYYKVVAEELRAFAKETNTILWTAAQFNRGGMVNTDAGMEDIAESKAIADTADGMWSITRTEEMDALGQIVIKQLKSRYNDKSVRLRFTVGVDVAKQKFYHVEQVEGEEFNRENHKGKSNEDIKKRFKKAKSAEEEDRPLNRFGDGGQNNFKSFLF